MLPKGGVLLDPDPEEAIRNQERTIASIDYVPLQERAYRPLDSGRRGELVTLHERRSEHFHTVGSVANPRRKRRCIRVKDSHSVVYA